MAVGSTTHPPTVCLPTVSKTPQSDSSTPQEIAQAWLSQFAAILASNDISQQLPSVFHDECFWRDALSLTWDYHTLHGLEKVTSFLKLHLSGIGFDSFKLREHGAFTPAQTAVSDTLVWIESMFTFETAAAHGRGVLRLTPDDKGVWKAYVVYTALQELKGHEWAVGAKRPHGGKNTLEGGIVKGNWFERRQREKEFLDEEPTCLVIGAGMYLYYC
jgi:hypothetical protein